MAAIAEDIGWLNFPLITGGRVSRLHIRISTAAVPGHPDALLVPALAADAAVRVRRVRAVLEVVAAACRQDGIEFLGPFLVGFGESLDLIRRQVKVADYRPEGLARWPRGAFAASRRVAVHVHSPASASARGRCVLACTSRSCNRHSSVRSCHAPPEIGDLDFAGHEPLGAAEAFMGRSNEPVSGERRIHVDGLELDVRAAATAAWPLAQAALQAASITQYQTVLQAAQENEYLPA
jgi:hypothetical protein